MRVFLTSFKNIMKKLSFKCDYDTLEFQMKNIRKTATFVCNLSLYRRNIKSILIYKKITKQSLNVIT